MMELDAFVVAVLCFRLTAIVTLQRSWRFAGVAVARRKYAFMSLASLYAVLLITFAIIGTTWFGPTLAGYGTVYASVYTLVLNTLGYHGAGEQESQRTVQGVVLGLTSQRVSVRALFHVVFLLFGSLMVQVLVLTCLAEGYFSVKAEMTTAREQGLPEGFNWRGKQLIALVFNLPASECGVRLFVRVP
jgi:hypothetical protein